MKLESSAKYLRDLLSLLVLLFVVSCSRTSTTEYYYPADLKGRTLPVWQVTNAIPLTPDHAVIAAMEGLKTKHSDIASWEVDSIDLRKDYDYWVYNIMLTARQSGRLEFQNVKVLMDGSIWEPSTERRK
ncbi:MAG TPA: hypothetical protein VFW05_05015 [Verrucomicrobiae bacterium]|nr:hypothetical protein [Verrucomicrobiae bacterium]